MAYPPLRRKDVKKHTASGPLFHLPTRFSRCRPVSVKGLRSYSSELLFSSVRARMAVIGDEAGRRAG
jgi:hypothetical protein